MVGHGRPALRDLFDDAPTPLIGHPPATHHLDYYLATDGSYRRDGGGLGAVIETNDGHRVARLSRPDTSPDNNVAEYRALHLGLDVLSTRIPDRARVGILVDHKQLATNVNAVGVHASESLPGDRSITVPSAAARHWRGIRARITSINVARAARVNSPDNPAHPLANEPAAYDHLGEEPTRCVMPKVSPSETPPGVPPPSRARPRSSD